ncbi:MAG: transporter substrate-binding domain-containing protein [Pseudomonadota bacterium]
MIRTLCLGLALALVAGADALARCADHVPQQRPQNVARDIVGTDLDTIQERGFITFAAYEDFAPYSFVQNGKPAGIDIEIGKIIADELGVEARFKLVAAGETLDADLRNWIWKGPIVGGRVANVMLHVPYDSEFACRIEQVVFTGQYYDESIAIAYDAAHYPDGGPTVPYFRTETVGVENDSLSDFYLSNFNRGMLQPNIVRFASTDAAMTALDEGTVSAVMGPRTQLQALSGEGVAVHSPPLMGLSRGRWTVGVAVSFLYRPLAYSVGDAIYAGISDGRIAAAFEEYGAAFHPPTW